MAALLKLYVLIVSLISIAGLVYVYVKPPPSMLLDRDGVAHFTPSVVHIETGEPVALGELIRHFRGD
ncbi:hypothetical protein AB833_05435 [Chromatiales bacterium (ex Bugula neritina AB1)]|nr:hypothetical protein AB833_05435 [Chromatiales bacterium (ex Bugula neritina AB1)]